MDNIRDRLNQNNKNKRSKLLIALLILVVLIAGIVMLEVNIYNNIKDITIIKENISDDKATFISVKPLDTNIIAVKSSDGKIKLAFDDCISCYNQYGKHYKFKNNKEKTGLVCKNCKEEVMYDSMGFVPEGCMPFPISIEAESGIRDIDDSIIISATYLERMKEELSNLRTGKPMNFYRENPNK